jgi:hypothetical protein
MSSAGHKHAKTRQTQELPDYWAIELHSERAGMFFYSYRRLRIERTGRRAAIREFTFKFERSVDTLETVTKPQHLVRQRGRSLPTSECDRIWRAIAAFRPDDLAETHQCLDDVDPSLLDDSVWPDGTPIGITCGDEGPACLTLRAGRAKEGRVKRVVVDRYTSPSRLCTDALRASRSPLASIISLIDPGVRETQALTYRQSRPLADLQAEFLGLKARNFLNLREFEVCCLEAVGSLRDPLAVPFVVGELFAPEPRVRLQALNTLATIGHSPAAKDVELLYYDDELSVRERAREVLEVLKGHSRV